MRPVARGDQKHYMAEGDWKLAGKYEGRPGAALRILRWVRGTATYSKFHQFPFDSRSESGWQHESLAKPNGRNPDFALARSETVRGRR